MAVPLLTRCAWAFGLLLVASACHRSAAPPSTSHRLTTLPARPQLMFVSLAGDDTFHKVAVASFAHPADGAYYTDLSCERVYFGSTRGICLNWTLDQSKTVWSGQIFGEHFERLHQVPLTGEPSRVRVSPDGRLAAATVFESGHSYSDHGFSTRTTVFDLEEGTSLGDLEQFVTTDKGRAVREEDFNFWGLTFAKDSDTFYATLDTKGVSYLVKGSVSGRRMEIVKAGVECPSLSPDNTRVAFKSRVGVRERGWWQLAVLRLDTLEQSMVTAETRSVDDQVEWLDDDRVVYHLSGGTTAADLWAVRVDNQKAPERLLASAYSPAVIR